MNTPDDPTIPIPRSQPGPPELGGLDPMQLLQGGLHTVRPSSGAQTWHPPTPGELAALLPQYQIEALIGHGGMGAVYRGRQTALDRPVAVKLLPAEVAADADFIARFQREARTLARLQHPGIVAVHEFGQTPAGHLFFVMEFVDGTDLSHLIHGPGLSPAQTLEITVQICEALNYAHSQGVMHRDIKPANVLITRDGRAKLADFGLARPVDEETASITRPSIVMGTLGYMAPEQRMGMADHRADIFSLGVMLYEMLTGRTPEGIFDPPSKAVQVDVRLDEVVVKALQQLPERRYQQAREMKTDVDHIRTTPAMKPSEPAGRRTRTKPRVLILSGMAAAVVVGTGTFFLARKPQAPLETQVTRKHEDSPPDVETTRPALSATVSIPGLPDLPPLDIPLGEPGFVKNLVFPGNYLYDFKILPDSRRMLVFQDRTVKLVDLHTGTPAWAVPVDAKTNACALSRDATRFAQLRLCDENGRETVQANAKKGVIDLRQTSDGAIIQTWTLPVTKMGVAEGQLALSPSGDRMMVRVGANGSGLGSDAVCFMALEKGKTEPLGQWVVPGHNGHVTTCLDEDHFLSTGNGSPVLLQFSQPGRINPFLNEIAILRNAVSREGKLMAATHQGSTLALWELSSHKRLFYLEGGPSQPDALAFAGNGLLVGLGDQSVTYKKGGVPLKLSGLLMYGIARAGRSWSPSCLLSPINGAWQNWMSRQTASSASSG